ncbi:MAG: hypothetical protein U1D30_08160 [Planctomycetota bacterium]
MRISWKWMVAIFVALALVPFFGTWVWFHSIPRQADLQKLLRNADRVEIFRMVEGKPIRWVELTNPTDWSDLPERIHYQASYWEFSGEPRETVVVQTFQKKERKGAWEVRGDGCLHIRKSARWYKMPVEGEFEKRVLELLAKRGSDLPAAENGSNPREGTVIH